MPEDLQQQIVGVPPVGESCGDCKFMITRRVGDNPYCECHAHPPPTPTATWPKILEDDWCGEYIKVT